VIAETGHLLPRQLQGCQLVQQTKGGRNDSWKIIEIYANNHEYNKTNPNVTFKIKRKTNEPFSTVNK
jgi:hypothetical protein